MFQQFARAGDFGGEFCFFRQRGEVFAHKHFVGQTFEGIAGERFALFGAKDYTHRWILIGPHPVCAGIIAVEVHLADVGGSQLVQLEVEYDQTAQTAMEEHQVNAIPPVVNSQPTLPTDKCEIATKFEHECF